MSNFKEIVAKAVVGKGKKAFINSYELEVKETPSTILGCWIINHNFSATKEKDSVKVNGSFDTNIWYSTDNNTRTDVAKDTITYEEIIPITKENDYDGQDEVIARMIKQPTCTKAEIKDGKISYTIEKMIAAELVGDTKLRVGIDQFDETEMTIEDEINNEVKEDFLK